MPNPVDSSAVNPFLRPKGPNAVDSSTVNPFLVSKTEGVPITRGLPPAPAINIPGAEYLNSPEGRELIRQGVMDPEGLGPGEKRQFNAILEAYPEIQEVAHRMRAIRESEDTRPEQKRAETLQDIVESLGKMTAESVAAGEGNAKYLWKLFDTFMTGAGEVFSPTERIKALDEAFTGGSMEGTMSDALAEVFAKGDLETVEPGDDYQVWNPIKGENVTLQYSTAQAIGENLVRGAVRLAPELLGQLMDNPYVFAKGLATFPYEEMKLILQASGVGGLPVGTAILPLLSSPEEVATARKELMRNPIGVVMLGLVAIGAGRGLNKAIETGSRRLLVKEADLIKQEQLKTEAVAVAEKATKAEARRASEAEAALAKERKQPGRTAEDLGEIQDIQNMSRAELVIEANRLQEAKLEPADRIPPGELVKMNRGELENLVAAKDIAETISKRRELGEARSRAETLEAQRSKAQQELDVVNNEWREVKDAKLDEAGQARKAEIKARRDAARAEVDRLTAEAKKVSDQLAELEKHESLGPEKPKPPEAPQEPAGEATAPESKPLPTQMEIAVKRAEQVTAEELARAEKQKTAAEESTAENEVAIEEIKESVAEASKAHKPILVVMQKNLEAQQARNQAIITEAEGIIKQASERGVKDAAKDDKTVKKVQSEAAAKAEADAKAAPKEEVGGEAIAKAVTEDPGNPYTVTFDAVGFPPGAEQYTVTAGAGRRYSVNFKKGEATPEALIKRFDEKVAAGKALPKAAEPEIEPPAPITEGTEAMKASRSLGHHKEYIQRIEKRLADEKYADQHEALRKQLLEAKVEEAELALEVDRIRSEALDRVPPVELEDVGIRVEKTKDITLDPKRFQNREAEFSEESVERIITAFDPAKFDPVVVWKDPVTGDQILLSGHSRFEAMRRMGREQIPVREYKGTEAEAINFAKVEANRLQTAEGLRADIRAYQIAKDSGASTQELVNSFGSERLGNLEAWSNLNPKGAFIDALTNPAADSIPYIKRWSRNVGELRKDVIELTNAHEKQMFDAIYKDPGLIDMSKADFTDMVNFQVSDITWDPSKPLIFKKGRIPVTGTRARADTGRLVERIDKLEKARKEARTPEEHKVLTDEIQKMKAAIATLMKDQGAFELGALGTPADYKAFADAVKAGMEQAKAPPGVEVVPVPTEALVTVVRKPKDWKTSDVLKSPSRSYRKLNPAAGDIADMGHRAVQTYKTGLERANADLNNIFFELRATIKQKAKAESAAGWFTYKKAFKEAKHSIFDYLDRKVTEVELAEMKPEVRQAYRATRDWYESYRERIIEERRAQGLKIPDDWGIADYMTHMFRGNWRLHKRTEGQWSLIEGGLGETEAAVMKKAKALLKENPTLDLKIQWDSNIPSDLATRLSRGAFNAITKQLTEKTSLSPTEIREVLVTSQVGIKPAKTKWFRYGQQRRGTKGYGTDIVEVLETYAATTERWLAMNEFRRKATPLLDELNAQPQLKEQVSEYIDVVSGKRVRGSAEFDNFLQGLPFGFGKRIKPMALERWARTATKTQAIRLLSRPSTALTNWTQFALTVYPRVGGKIALWAEKKGLTEEGRAFAEKHGVHNYTPSFFSESSIAKKGIKTRPSDVPLKLFSLAEQLNRRRAFLAGHKYAKDILNYPEPEAVAYGKGMVRKTQFDNSMADIQPIFRHPIMKVIGQFKAFQFKYIEQLWDLRGAEIPRSIAAHFVAGGLKTIVRPVNWLKVGGMYELYDYLTEEYGEETANFISYGLPGLLHADMSASLAVDVVPYGTDAKEQAINFLAGPTGAMGFDIASSIDDIAAAAPSDRKSTIVRGFERVIPLTKLGVAAYDLATGEHNVADSRGQIILEDISTREMLSRLIGLRMLRESLAHDLVDLSIEEQEARTKVKREYYNNIMSGDVEAAVAVLDDYDNELMKKERFIIPLGKAELDQYFSSSYSRELDDKLSRLVPEYNNWIKEELQRVVAGEK